MSSNNIFYIVRHGETEHNVNGIVQGHTDSNLTPNGVEQAQKVAEIFKDIKFDKAFSSDMIRTQDTARIILSDRNLSIDTSELLRERNYGSYDGGPGDVFRSENASSIEMIRSLPKHERRVARMAPGVESDADINRRMIEFLNRVNESHSNNTILVVSSGGIMRSFLNHMEWNGENDLSGGAIRNTGYVKVSVKDGNFIVEDFYEIDRGLK